MPPVSCLARRRVPVPRWYGALTAGRLPESLRHAFRLRYNEREQRRAEPQVDERGCHANQTTPAPLLLFETAGDPK